MTNEQHLEILAIEQVDKIVFALGRISDALDRSTNSSRELASEIAELTELSAINADMVASSLDKIGLNGASTNMGALEIIAKELKEIKEGM